MSEWILILTMHIIGPVGEIRDVSPEIVSGFTTEQSCEDASKKIGIGLIDLVGKARNQQGISGGSRKSEPSIYSKCIRIKK